MIIQIYLYKPSLNRLIRVSKAPAVRTSWHNLASGSCAFMVIGPQKSTLAHGKKSN